jgi:hypothetical protein
VIRHCQWEKCGHALPETRDDYWSLHKEQQEALDWFDFFFLSAWMGNVHAWSGHGQIGQSPTKRRHARLRPLHLYVLLSNRSICSVCFFNYFRVQLYAICIKNINQFEQRRTAGSHSGGNERYSLLGYMIACFLLGLDFDSEDRSEMFLQNIGWLWKDYMALYPRTWNISLYIIPIYI